MMKRKESVDELKDSDKETVMCHKFIIVSTEEGGLYGHRRCPLGIFLSNSIENTV